MALPIDVSSIDLLFHEESTRTHWHALTRTDAHAEALCDGRVPDCFLPPLHRICVSDCFLLPSHSHLRLYGASGPNQLVCVPLTPQARAALFCSYGCAYQGSGEYCPYGSCSYTGPATCISCEAGKFSTASSPRCSTVMQALHTCLLSEILLPRMYDVAAACVSSCSSLVCSV
jgi:hypothetical protein